jgi:hypothetical protein
MRIAGVRGLLSHVVPHRRFSGSVQRQCIPHEAGHPTRVFPRLQAAPCGIHCLTLGIMKYFTPCFLLLLIVSLLSCGRDNRPKWNDDFSGRYLQAQHDYCSTNLFVAVRGLDDFRQWLSDPKHSSEPLLNRDEVLFHINGRLFLLEEYLGNTRMADEYYEKSVQAYDKYLRYIQSLPAPPPPHALEPISTKEQLRDHLAHQDKGLDVGWMKNGNDIAK